MANQIVKERGNVRAKKLDFWLGIPLVFLLGLLRKATTGLLRQRTARKPTAMRRLGVLKSSAIGDTVLLSAIVKDLVAAGVQVTVFTGASNFRSAELLMPGVRVEKLPMLNPFKAIRAIRAHELDAFVDADSWPRINAVLAFFARAQWRIGFRTEGQGRHFVFDEVLEHSKARHEIENYRALFAALGFVSQSLPQISSVGQKSSRKIIFHPWPGGARAAEKMWPTKNWLAVAETFKKQGFEIALSGGPADFERTKALIVAAPQGLFSQLETKSLEDLFRALAEATAVVTVDTGVAHLSAALGQRTLVLHGPTSPTRWGALGPRVRALKDEQVARIHLGFESAESSEVLLTVHQVTEALESLLQES